MKIKNVKDKLIHIGEKSIMPGETIEISKETAELPSVRCLIRMGYLKEVGDTAKAKKGGRKPKDDDNNGEKAAETGETAAANQ